MEMGKWVHKRPFQCPLTKKASKSPEEILQTGDFEAAPTAGGARKQRAQSVHNGHCCQQGVLLSLTSSQNDRLENAHLTALTREAGYSIRFIPKYHCGAWCPVVSCGGCC